MIAALIATVVIVLAALVAALIVKIAEPSDTDF